MEPGTVVGERFAIERFAGSGGMGTVYRALDRHTGEPVAVKVLRETAGHGVERFDREGEVLAGLVHPGIVRHVAHGLTARGEQYLAIEWLEGESLAERLGREPLGVADALALGARVADALAVAHGRGIVHRDIKPGNLFLPGGAIHRVKVLDFGIARVADPLRALTRTGVLIGTPGYMAPEQARGERVDARADLFALGCVLFRALSGRGPFDADDLLAVLFKSALAEEVPRLAEVLPGVPPAVDELVAWLMARAPGDRPATASAAAAALRALGDLSPHAAGLDAGSDGARAEGSARPAAPAGLTGTEQRVLCAILALTDAVTAEATLVEPTFTTDDLGPASDLATSVVPAGAPAEPPTVSDGVAARAQAVHAAAGRHGGQLDLLHPGAILVSLTALGSATDLAARAARCALELRGLLPGAPMALVSGRAVVRARRPIGEAIDRGVTLLQRGGGIRLDDVTAGLLDARFEVGGDEVGLVLLAERDADDTARSLLGRPTPCVGRDRELGMLEGIFAECASEPIARAVLVTAPAGVGKSRLRHELVRRIRARAGDAAAVWLGRGDPMSASPFATLAPALRRAAGIAAGEPLAVQQQKLRARAGRHVAPAERERVAEFLGELVGVRFPAAGRVRLAAAREDPQLLTDQTRRAFEDFLAAECAAGPVVLVLEDLHAGDAVTVKLVGGALRALAERPFFVIAFARPEVSQVFPELWPDRSLQTFRLGELSKKGSEELVRAVLGPAVAPERVALLVERAAGNAFYLEELIRAVAEGRDASLPGTVLAMVQARLEGLDPESRRVLRGGSVLGERFWRGALLTLLGGDDRTVRIDEQLDELVRLELVRRAGTSRFAGDDEYAFRHALVRDGAYAMLTDADRALGHRLAGAWLARAGEPDALVLAEHFERGGEPAAAVGRYHDAAEQALGASDLEGAVARAERGIACGAEGPMLGLLHLRQAEACSWLAHHAEAARHETEALRHLRPGSASWYAAAAGLIVSSARLGDRARMVEVGETLERVAEGDSGLSAPPADPGDRGDPEAARIVALARSAVIFLLAGKAELGERLLAILDREAPPLARRDPGVRAPIERARAARALRAGDAGAYLHHAVAAATCFEQVGSDRGLCMQRVSVGYAYLEVGAYAEAEVALRDALARALRLGIESAAAAARNNLGLALARRGAIAEGRAVEEAAVAQYVAHGERRMEGASRNYLAKILLLAGEPEAAEAEAARAVAAMPAGIPLRVYTLGTLAEARLAAGHVAEALAAADEAMAELDRLGAVDEGEALVRLIHAEARRASGDPAGAREAVLLAKRRLLDRAAKIADPELRAGFLERVPEHARTFALARALATRRA